MYERQISEIKASYEKQLYEQKEMYERQILYLRGEIQNMNNSTMSLFETAIVNSAKAHGDITVSNTGNTNNISNINYITKNYTSAPEFKPIPCTKLKNLIKRNDHIEVLADWYIGNILEERLAGMIVEFYVKENPKEQSIFATDVVRYNYLIMLRSGENLSWITDKGGIKVNELAIVPIINLLKSTLKSWRMNFLKLKENQFDDELLEPINNIIADVESGKLNKSIMKIISPKLALNKKITSDKKLNVGKADVECD